jgi:hypothetical protein
MLPDPNKAPVVKTRKAKKPVVLTVTLSKMDCFSPRSAIDALRPAFRALPSPQSIILPVNGKQITISREKNKGATAQWFLVDVKGSRFEGTKKLVQQEAGIRMAVAFRE